MKSITLISLQVLLCFCSFGQIQRNRIGLQFDKIPVRWDEGLPLGNGLIGELIWQKEDKLRFSLDHAKLWDMRLMQELHTPGFNYKWVKEQVLADNYATVQKIGDKPWFNYILHGNQRLQVSKLCKRWCKFQIPE